MLDRLTSIFNSGRSPGQQRISQERRQLAEAAEHAAHEAEKTGNRVYRLHNLNADEDPNRPFRFLAVGCQGSGDEHQVNVARLMNDLSADPDTKPDFVLILGDNVYDFGATSANDHNISKCFDQIYLRDQFGQLQQMPFFLLLGNHDENRQRPEIAALVKESGIARGMHQVAHSYMGDNKFSLEDKQYLYEHASLDVKNLPSWNMPHRYYSLIAGDVQIFCVDSNTYAKDYLELLLHPESMNAENNQAAWLQEEVAKARVQGRKVILAQHHPLYTPGKRAYHNDLKIYLEYSEIAALASRLNLPVDKHTTYNMLLKSVLGAQQLEFDVTLTAHDHNIYYYNNKNTPHHDYKLCQVTVGGGGGELQERAKFSAQHQMGCFLKRNGVALISHVQGTPDFTLQFRTVDKNSLEFNSNSHQAVVHFDHHTDTDKNAILKFFAVVQSALNEYLSFLSNRQEEYDGKFLSRGKNLTHGKLGADRAHQLWAYINRPQPASFPEIVAYVHRMTEWTNPLTVPADHSLITILDRKMYAEYGKTMLEFAADPTPASMNANVSSVSLHY